VALLSTCNRVEVRFCLEYIVSEQRRALGVTVKLSVTTSCAIKHSLQDTTYTSMNTLKGESILRYRLQCRAIHTCISLTHDPKEEFDGPAVSALGS
jgi:hypothetical protein